MPKKKVIKRKITKQQFLTILDRAIAKKSDSASAQTSESHRSDDYSEKRTHSSKTEGT